MMVQNKGKFFIAFVATLFSIFVVWIDVLQHNYVKPYEYRSGWAKLSSDRVPIIEEMSKIDIGVSASSWRTKPVESADEFLHGKYSIEELGLVAQPLLDFDFLYTKGLPTAQLIISSLSIENTLLNAYSATMDKKYLYLARSRMEYFLSYYKGGLSVDTFLNNDHAVAARVSVILKYILVLHSSFPNDKEAMKSAVEGLVENVRFLKEDRYFLYRTNHGVMQNVALLQFVISFPEYEEAHLLKSIAMNRFNAQLEYYVSKEGVALEHSAGYHILAEELLGYVLSLYNILGIESNNIESKLALVKDFSNKIIRPNLSIPVYGNTGTNYVGGKIYQDWNGLKIYPVSGYAVSSIGHGHEYVHLTQIWSNFSTKTHKKADDLSLYLYSKNLEWVGGFGYWPYGTEGEIESYGWSSSNAPHSIGEKEGIKRESKLLNYAGDKSFSFTEVERINEKSQIFDRQTMVIGGNVLVIDKIDSAGEKGAVNWSFHYTANFRELDPFNFEVQSPQAAGAIYVSIDGIPKPEIRLLRGSKKPFTGWYVGPKNVVYAAPALALTQQSNSSVTVSLFSTNEPNNGEPVDILDYTSDDAWEIQFNCFIVERSRQLLSAINSCTSESKSIELTEVNVEGDVRRINSLSAKEGRKYPYFKHYMKERSIAVGVLFVSLLFFCLSLGFVRRKEMYLYFWLSITALFDVWVLFLYLS